MQKIAIASDHGGIELKEDIKTFLKERGFDVLDMGTNGSESVDYPDYGVPLAEKVSKGELEKGILICGTGIGMSIAANKHNGIRAAVVESAISAKLAREHNDANILVLPARFIEESIAVDTLYTFLHTPFEGGRHARRLAQLHRH